MIIVSDLDDTLIPNMVQLFTSDDHAILRRVFMYDPGCISKQKWNILRMYMLYRYGYEYLLQLFKTLKQMNLLTKDDSICIYLTSNIELHAVVFDYLTDLLRKVSYDLNIQLQCIQNSTTFDFVEKNVYKRILMFSDITKYLVIDDSPSRIGTAHEYGLHNAYLIDRPWNRQFVYQKRIRIPDISNGNQINITVSPITDSLKEEYILIEDFIAIYGEDFNLVKKMIDIADNSSPIIKITFKDSTVVHKCRSHCEFIIKLLTKGHEYIEEKDLY